MQLAVQYKSENRTVRSERGIQSQKCWDDPCDINIAPVLVSVLEFYISFLLFLLRYEYHTEQWLISWKYTANF